MDKPTAGTRESNKVVIALPNGLAVGGVETWSVELAGQLLSAGFQPTLALYPAPPGVPLRKSMPAEIPSFDLETPSYCQISQANVARVGRELPAVIIPNTSLDAYAACAVLSATRADQMRVLGYCHGPSENDYFLFRQFEKIIHTIIALSAEIRDHLCAMLPHRTNDIIYRPLAIHVPGVLTRTYAARSSPLRLVYAGRIEQHNKQVLHLLDLAKRLASLNVDFTLRIVGEGSSKARLQTELSGLPSPLRERITVEPGVPNSAIPDLLQRHDIAVQLSAYEATSLFMLESMAAGCVPVMTRISGATSVIQERVNGFTFPVGNLARMAELIRDLDRDRALLARMGEHAHESMAPFSREQYLPWFVDILHGLWQKPAAPWPAHAPIFPPHLTFLSKCADFVPGSKGMWRFLRRAARGGA